MGIDELLDKLDDMIDKSWNLPLSGGRCVLDAEKVREIIDEIRLNLPKEIRQARAIVSDRTEIIKSAKSEASGIVKSAEEKANNMVSQDEITRKAQDKANELLRDAQQKTKDMKLAAADFADRLMKSTEDSLTSALGEVHAARQALKTPAKL